MIRCQDAVDRVKNFRYEGKYCDLRVQVEDRVFNCHRLVLASAMEYFETALSEDSITKLTLPADVEASAFEIILRSIYNTETPIFESKHVPGLLLATWRLRLDNYSECCETFIRENTSRVNVARIFNIVRFISHSSLTIYLTEYILTRFASFVQKYTFLEMSYDDLCFILKRYRQSVPYASKSFVFPALIQWTWHLFEERKSYFPKLVDIVDECENSIFCQYARDLIGQYFLYISHIILTNGNLPDGRHVSQTCPLPTPPSLSFLYRCVQFLGKSKPQLLIRFPYLDSQKLHMEKYVVVSWNPFKTEFADEWYEWCAFNRYAYHGMNAITLFTSNKHELVYCLDRGYKGSSFVAYSSLDCLNGTPTKQLSVEYPINNLRFPYLCGIDDLDHIYVYDTDLFNFHYRTRRSVIKFTRNESRRGIFRYNCKSDRWSSVPAMQQKLAHCGVATDGRLLYLIGGAFSSGQVPRGFVQAYDHRTPVWLRMSNTMFAYPYEPATCSVNGNIYVSDGRHMETYDAVAGQWRPIECPSELTNQIPDCRPLQVWMINNANDLWIFDKLSSSFIIYNPISESWSRRHSFENEIAGLKEFCDYRDYGLQNVFNFKSGTV